MGTVSEYLATIEGADRAALERVYSIARDVVAEAEEGTSYGMSALLFNGKGLVTTLKTRKYLSLYPYSGAVVRRSSATCRSSRRRAEASTIRPSTSCQMPRCDGS